MSRFHITTPTGDQFVYGYDRPTQQYFLDAISTSNNTELDDIYLPWVGFDSPRPEWSRGTNVNLIEAMDHFGIWTVIPETHRTFIVMDLPIPSPAPAAP